MGWLTVLFGVFLGITLTIFVYELRTAKGVLKVDFSDLDYGPNLFLEIPSTELYTLYKRDRITLKIDLEISRD